MAQLKFLSASQGALDPCIKHPRHTPESERGAFQARTMMMEAIPNQMAVEPKHRAILPPQNGW